MSNPDIRGQEVFLKDIVAFAASNSGYAELRLAVVHQILSPGHISIKVHGSGRIKRCQSKTVAKLEIGPCAKDSQNDTHQKQQPSTGNPQQAQSTS